MGESTTSKLHLKLPAAMLEALRPTGCRASKEAQAAWLLGAAIEVARELKLKGELPIIGLAIHNDGVRPKEINIPLSREQIAFLTETSREEGGSRGLLTREFLATAQKVAGDFQGCLNHEGLVKEIKKLFPHLA
jgi:hypothetical protein